MGMLRKVGVLMKWSDVRREIRSIPDNTKHEHDVIAYLVARIVDRRHELKLTQQEVSERSGVTQSQVARMENGGAIPRLDTLLKIALALDLELAVISREVRHYVYYNVFHV